MVINKMLSANVQFVKQKVNLSTMKSKLLRKHFGIPLSKVKGIDKLNLSDKHLADNAEFCERMGFSKEEWLRHPNLLKFNKYHLEFQYLNLKEGGFVDINPAILSSSQGCISKTVSVLKHYNFIPNDVNVAEKFVSHLNLPQNKLKIDDLTDDKKYKDIYKTILLRYLTFKFNTSKDIIHKHVRNLRTDARSLVLLQKNLSYLEEIGIPRDKIFKSGIGLVTHPDANRELIKNVLQLGDLNFLKNIQKYPLLMAVKYENYVKIYDYLRKFQFSDKTIQQCMNIFLFNPDTIKIRLIEIKSIPELNVLSDNVPTLKLIIMHNQARSKLSFLNSINFKHGRFSILNGTKKAFKNYVGKEYDENYDQEVYLLINRLFKNTDNRFAVVLKKHTMHRQVPLLEIEKTYNFIRSVFKFSDASIAKVLQILLYSSDDLEKTYKDISKSYTFERKPTDVETLNLMMYHMEKDSQFSGCAAEIIRKESSNKSGLVDNEPICKYS